MSAEWDAWLAGFVDGEGCIFVDGAPNNHGPQVKVANTYLPSLEAIQEREGGRIHEVRRYRPNHKVGYEWRLTSPEAITDLLTRLRPHLRVKEVEAWLMLEFLAQRRVTPRGAERAKGVSPEERALREGFRLALQGAK